MNLTGKFYRFHSKGLFDTDIFPNEEGILINYDVLSDKDKEDIILSMDFTIDKTAIRENIEKNCKEDLGKPCWKLVDSQDANLGNIEADEFNVGDYDSIMDRLDNYYHDYGYYFVYELESSNTKYDILEELETI